MAHTSSCRNTRIEPLKPVSTCFGEIRETEGSLLFPVSQVGPPSGPRFDPENQRIDRLSTRSSCLCDLIFDSNVLDSGYFACNLYRYVSRWKFRRSEILVLFFLRCLYSSCNYRFFTYFFFSSPSSYREDGVRSKFLWIDCYRILALVQVCLRFTA